MNQKIFFRIFVALISNNQFLSIKSYLELTINRAYFLDFNPRTTHFPFFDSKSKRTDLLPKLQLVSNFEILVSY